MVQCQHCGQIYYSLMVERMSLDREDDLEVFQIPVTEEESLRLQEENSNQPDLTFLNGRKAKALFPGGSVTEIQAEAALKRCGRFE
ncbi:hypothetical protein [Gorillibacterium sp. sgz5001074]|uniref:hypothetical protein n=1 Tax=Gorillibacterium sp. sgz5001074 TaxID=3446695 RepID=UPI003F67F16D